MKLCVDVLEKMYWNFNEETNTVFYSPDKQDLELFLKKGNSRFICVYSQKVAEGPNFSSSKKFVIFESDPCHGAYDVAIFETSFETKAT